jgi:ADP-ribose pyrophosphatase YjhB (NUDIX family)
VVLVRHTYVSGLYLPGGGVERGESAETALARELAEEAGIGLAGAPRLWGVYSNERHHRGDHVLVYRIAEWRECAPDSAGEIAETLWADPLDPPADITPGTRRRLAEIYGGQAPQSDW